jgi:hypothetical protein
MRNGLPLKLHRRTPTSVYSLGFWEKHLQILPTKTFHIWPETSRILTEFKLDIPKTFMTQKEFLSYTSGMVLASTVPGELKGKQGIHFL